MPRLVHICSSPKYLFTMNIKAFSFVLALAAVAAGSLSSCVDPKEVVLIQDASYGTTEPLSVNYQTTIQKDDQLIITVSSKQPELTQPFMVSELGSSTTNGNSGGRTYQVDANGRIVLPVIGTMTAVGKTCSQLAQEISASLRNDEYIRDASVSVRIANFKYSVLGEVKSPGTKTVNGERITVLEAISQAGDFNDDASREVTIVREQNGKRVMAKIDLRTKEAFSSPFYYLQQNDVIYVTTSDHTFNMLRGDSAQWWSLTIGGVGFIAAIVALCLA